MITPYLRFSFKYTSAGDDKGDMDLTFRRRSDKMPEPPKARPSSAFLLRPPCTMQQFRQYAPQAQQLQRHIACCMQT